MIGSGGRDGSDISDESDEGLGRRPGEEDGAEGPFFPGDSFYIAKRCPYKWVTGSGEGRVLFPEEGRSWRRLEERD